MRIVVEIGANQGQDTEKFLADENTVLYAFEPVPKLAYDLWERFGKNERFHLIAAAIDTQEGFQKLNISEHADWGCSSLHDFAPDLKQKWNRPEFNYTNYVANVMCMRLDTFMIFYRIPYIDYLHIDAQGNDFRVLKSLGSHIQYVRSGVCEAAQKVQLYDVRDNTVENVKPWLESYGFKVRVEDDGVGKPMATITGNEANLFFER